MAKRSGAPPPSGEPLNLAERLGTADPAQQSALLTQLMQPTITLVLTLDPRADDLSVTPICPQLETLGQGVAVEVLRHMLKLADDHLVRLAMQIAAQQGANQATKDSSPSSAGQPTTQLDATDAA